MIQEYFLMHELSHLHYTNLYVELPCSNPPFSTYGKQGFLQQPGIPPKNLISLKKDFLLV